MKKLMIIAPFWGQSAHVGVYRVDRFIRWLSALDIQIVLVCAGSCDCICETPWGMKLQIYDPLGLYREGHDLLPPRTPNRFRRLISYLIFNPDPSVVWAKHMAKHPLVLQHGDAAVCIISSGPPESAHVGAYLLSKKLKAKLVIDMRDGWLDEPLKPLLRFLPLQRWREGRLETSILAYAKHIFVTSSGWKEMLENRLPFTAGKTSVLTNGFAKEITCSKSNKQRQPSSDSIKLMHAGRFTGSRSSQKASCLLTPVLKGLEPLTIRGNILLLGNLEENDMEEVNQYKREFQELGWDLQTAPSVERKEMFRQLCSADGLLLLSMSDPVIPSKLFEYIPSMRPILAITPNGSAVWKACIGLPQVFLLDYSVESKISEIVNEFIVACARRDLQYDIPLQFTEEHLSLLFLQGIQLT